MPFRALCLHCHSSIDIISLFISLCESVPADEYVFPALEFHGLDEAMLLRALQALQQEHKAEIITLDDGRGVKFF